MHGWRRWKTDHDAEGACLFAAIAFLRLWPHFFAISVCPTDVLVPGTAGKLTQQGVVR